MWRKHAYCKLKRLRTNSYFGRSIPKHTSHAAHHHIGNAVSIIFIKSNGTWLYLAPFIIIFLSVVIIAAKYDLSPPSRKPEREARYRVGHWLLGITTLVTFVSVATPFVIAKIYSNNELTLYMWYVIPVVGIAFFTWAGGLYMVRSARA